MSKGSDYLSAFETEWFRECGITPTPDDMERLRGTAFHARARVHASLLDFGESLSPAQRTIASWSTAMAALMMRLTRPTRHP